MTGLRENDSDAALIRKIARLRDHNAFELLIQRHAAALYSAAYNITHQHQLAEESVQEGLLDVWRSAGTFRKRKGNVRNWLTRIVVHNSFEMKARYQKTQRIREKVMRIPAAPDRGFASAPDSRAGNGIPSTEQHELLIALHGLLAQLSDADRELLTLYYGAGFSQWEIADALKMPQRTISANVARALQSLQTGLKRAGFGSLTLGAELLAEALGSALPAPASLGRILRFVADECGRAKTLEPIRGRGGAASTWALPAALACGMALLVAGILYACGTFGRPVAPSGDPGPAGTPALVLGPGSNPQTDTAPQGGSGRFMRRWNFDSPGQLTVLSPPVRHNSGGRMEIPPHAFVAVAEGRVEQVMGKRAGGGCLEFGAGGIVLLGFGAARFPLKVSVLVAFPPNAPFFEFNPDLSGAVWGGRFDNLAHPSLYRGALERGAYLEINLYLTATTLDEWVKDAGRQVVLFFETPADGQGLFISSTAGLLLDELSLQEIDPAEAPDISDFAREFARLGAHVKPGAAIPVPALQSHAAPGVQVLFRRRGELAP